jgi:WD40 repeat protein
MYFEGHSSVIECMVVCKPWQPLDRHRLLLVTGSHDRRCCIFDLESGEKIRTLEDHTGAVTCIAVSSDGRRLFTGSADGTVRSYNMKNGSPLRTFDIDAPVSSMLWLQGALLVGTGHGTVLVFHQDVAVPAQILPGHTLGVVGLAQRSLGAGRHLLVTASTDKTVRAQILLLSVDKGKAFGGHPAAMGCTLPSERNGREPDASPAASAAGAPGLSPAHDWDSHCSQCMCCLEPMAVRLDVDALQADDARLGAAFAQELCAGCRSLLCLFQTTTADERVKQCKHKTCLLKCPACRQTRLR